jgi:hypothetical protein
VPRQHIRAARQETGRLQAGPLSTDASPACGSGPAGCYRQPPHGAGRRINSTTVLPVGRKCASPVSTRLPRPLVRVEPVRFARPRQPGRPCLRRTIRGSPSRARSWARREGSAAVTEPHFLTQRIAVIKRHYLTQRVVVTLSRRQNSTAARRALIDCTRPPACYAGPLRPRRTPAAPSARLFDIRAPSAALPALSSRPAAISFVRTALPHPGRHHYACRSAAPRRARRAGRVVRRRMHRAGSALQGRAWLSHRALARRMLHGHVRTQRGEGLGRVVPGHKHRRHPVTVAQAVVDSRLHQDAAWREVHRCPWICTCRRGSLLVRRLGPRSLSPLTGWSFSSRLN